ncbi:MAG: NAD-dependent epimerase/dehydratase family protein [Rubrivivax sp.]
MKVFGIGLTGYIGSVVVEKLQAAGHSVCGLARSVTAARELAEAAVEPIRGTLGDVQVIGNAARAADAVLGFSTGGFLTSALAPGVADAYGNTVSCILDALQGSGKPYMQISGTGFWFGNAWANPGLVLTEDIEPQPPYFYAANLAAHHALRRSAERGVRSIVVAPGQVYGRDGGYIGPVARRFDCARKHGAMYALQPAQCGTISYVHVDDLADLIVLALDGAEAGDLFFGVTDTVGAFDLARAVSRVCGFDGRVDCLSEHQLAAVDGPIAVGDFKATLLASSVKARQVLGWKPARPGLLESLRQMEGRVDIGSVYPEKKRQAMARTVRL